MKNIRPVPTNPGIQKTIFPSPQTRKTIYPASPNLEIQ